MITKITDLPKSARVKSKLRKFIRALGPGLVTGAADDDPSGNPNI